MKFSSLFMIGLLVTGSAFAQVKDLGTLLPVPTFEITPNKTTFKQEGIGNFKNKTTPEKEEYEYEEKMKNSQFEGTHKFTLDIKREAGKVVSVKSTYNSNNKMKNSKRTEVQAIDVLESGLVASVVTCIDDPKAIFDRCITMNKSVCDHLSKNGEANKLLLSEIMNCTDTFNKIKEQQKVLSDLSDKDFNKNMAGLFSLEKSLYNVKPANISNVTEVVVGYNMALAECDKLNRGGYLATADQIAASKVKLKQLKEELKQADKQ